MSTKPTKKGAVSFDIFQSQGFGKDKLRKSLLDRQDRLKNSVWRKTFPPSPQAIHAKKTNKQLLAGSDHSAVVALIRPWHVRPPPMPQTENLMAASVYMCEKADICRLFALFYHALGCHRQGSHV